MRQQQQKERNLKVRNQVMPRRQTVGDAENDVMINQRLLNLIDTNDRNYKIIFQLVSIA